ncbi:hypothetical protein GCM10023187_53420 [Nibrella viscosa]|uniref:PA14 domain-containing protein n=1 Tax=Nibrella viscosa TaxID=1084524 RepID=A0ABP8KZA5_9BACT
MQGIAQVRYSYDNAGNRIARINQGPDNNCAYSLSTSGGGNVNAGSQVTLSVSCSGSDCGNVSYSWSGNGISGTSSTVTFNAPSTAGNYTYTVTAIKTGCSKTATAQVTVGTPTNTGCGSGSGLTATYYSGHELQGNPIASITQGPIDLSGSEGQTITGTSVAGVNISARWEGQVEAPLTGNYTFNMRTDDGTRVWFNGQLMVDDWNYYPPTDHTFTQSLTAGTKYNIKIEWKQGTGGYEAKFFWTPPGQATQLVPACRLYPTGGTACTPAAGYATLKRWTGLNTSSLSDLSSQTNNFTITPASVSNVTELRTETSWGDSYGQQIQGYITAPQTGGYTFWISSDDQSELYLSTSESPSAMQRVAWVDNWTNPEVWNQEANQKSATINLVACQRYYFEIRHREGGWGDNLAVGWAKPGQSTASPSEIVPGAVLSPYSAGSCTPPAAPTLSASPSTINTGQSSVLTASGCGGTVSWSTGQQGSQITVSPGATTTYNATCSVNGCTSTNASIQVTVGSSGAGCGSGIGLTATYYTGTDLQGSPIATLTQGPIDFTGDGTQIMPGTNVTASNISARWEGQLEAPVTGTYTFNMRTDDGTRVWFNGQLVVDDWSYYPPKDHTFTVDLTAGTKYNIKVEWMQGGGGYEARLFWTPPGQATQLVPACRLYPNSSGCTPPAAPALSASSTNLTSGQSSVLTASGCAGTVSWSTGQQGNQITVTPGATTTYNATCSVNGCTSTAATITITVNTAGGGSNINCGSLEGHFDYADCGTLGGWVYDASNPNTVVNVDVYEGSTLISGNHPAGNFRQDLVDAGKGNGYHGFTISTPGSLKNGQSRSISIRVSGCTYTLNNSPKTITCSPGTRRGVFDETLTTGSELNVAPNPTNGEFEVGFYVEAGQDAVLSVVDLLGVSYYEQKLKGEGKHIEKVALPNKAPGLLIVQLRTGNKLLAKKIVVVR